MKIFVYNHKPIYIPTQDAIDLYDQCVYLNCTTQQYNDLFVDGPVDVAICQSTYLRDFYVNGFNPIERNYEVVLIPLFLVLIFIYIFLRKLYVKK